MTELAELHAYQAFPEGLIARYGVDLVSIADALAKFAAAPRTRFLVSAESPQIELAYSRLGSVLRLVCREAA
jgi:hypothetical protein